MKRARDWPIYTDLANAGPYRAAALCPGSGALPFCPLIGRLRRAWETVPGIRCNAGARRL